MQSITSEPVEELLLKLSDPKIQEIDGKRRAVATATLVYEPADQSARAVESKRFTFTAPLGSIEADDLRQYLESYHLWPTGVFQERAERIEEQLPHWGQDSYKAALATQSTQAALTAWQHTPDGAKRCFSVFIDNDLLEGTHQEVQAAAREAASQLLSLPWELLHDDRSYLFRGGRAVRVRRRLPNRQHQSVLPTRLPIRILLVSPRPEDERTSYIDHRISAKPLLDAVDSLGDLATLIVLVPPTFPALQQALQRAREARQPFDVVHCQRGTLTASPAIGNAGVRNLTTALIEVGLAEAMDYGHLRLDPVLPSYLLGQMRALEREVLSHAGQQACRS